MHHQKVLSVFLLNIDVCIYRQWLPSTLVWQSFCSGQQSMQRLIAGDLRSKDWRLSSKQVILINPPPPPPTKAQWASKRRGGKNARVKRWGGVLWNAVFWTCHCLCTQELTSAVVTCTRPILDQANQNFHISGAHDCQASVLIEKLLSADVCWDRENYSFLIVLPLLDSLCSNYASVGSPTTSHINLDLMSYQKMEDNNEEGQRRKYKSRRIHFGVMGDDQGKSMEWGYIWSYFGLYMYKILKE